MNDVVTDNLVVICPDESAENPLRFVVIAAQYGDGWIFVRHRDRSTYEIPGGHIDAGEDAWTAAKRELYEETGAVAYEILPVCCYSVMRGEAKSSGQLYYAHVETLDPLPPAYEMVERIISRTLPEALTYPQIQPKLQDAVLHWLAQRG